MVPWRAKLTMAKQKQQKFLNTHMTSNMKLYKTEITPGQYKTRKFSNFGMNLEEQGQFDGQWGMTSIEFDHKSDWESNMEITNITRN